MSIKGRLKKLELKLIPKDEYYQNQEELLEAFIQIETFYNGRPPTNEEIEAERQKLAQPIKKYSHEEQKRMLDEVERLFDKYARGEGDEGVV